jgi:hypothetical protein
MGTFAKIVKRESESPPRTTRKKVSQKGHPFESAKNYSHRLAQILPNAARNAMFEQEGRNPHSNLEKGTTAGKEI